MFSILFQEIQFSCYFADFSEIPSKNCQKSSFFERKGDDFLTKIFEFVRIS